MKKTFFCIATILVFGNMLTAQENEKSLLNKNGKEILPQKGDFCFGIDALPFLEYAGNFFSMAGNNSVDLRLPDGSQTFLIKYVLKPDMFIRSKIRLGFNTFNDKEFIMQAGQTDPTILTKDSYKKNTTNFEIALGIEKRKGNNRLQGFYGGQLGYISSSLKESYSYGNPITNADPLAFTTVNFGNNINSNNARTLDKDYGTNSGFSLGLFFGAEYFFAPKLSLSGEFGWNLTSTKIADGQEEFETWDNTTNAIKKYKIKSYGESNFGFDNTINGLLNLSLYF